jgi:hypothetical protein
MKRMLAIIASQKTRKCAVVHLFTEEFEVVIMIEVVDRRDAWVGSRL